MLKERLLNFIKFQGLTVSGFESKVGLSNGSVSRTNDNMRRRTVEAISVAFPELNTKWLLTGEGEMLQPNNFESNAKEIGRVYPVGSKDDEVIMVDFVPVAATASFIENLSDGCAGWEEKTPLILEGNERAEANSLRIFEVDGESMYPTLLSGARVLAKEIPERSWHYAEGVVVAVYSEFVTVKRVAANRLLTDNYIILRSDNEKYGEMTVPLSDLRGLFKVKRIISSTVR